MSTVSDADILAAVNSGRDTAFKVADYLGMDDIETHQRLWRLIDSGQLDCRANGSQARVFPGARRGM